MKLKTNILIYCVLAFTYLVFTSCSFNDEQRWPLSKCSCDTEEEGFDGKWLYRGYDSGIYVNEDGVETRIHNDYGRYLSWSPDGEKICYVPGLKYVNYGYGITILNTDGSVYSTPVSGQNARTCLMPVWSPDGEQIAYMKQDTFGFYDRTLGAFSLHIVDLDGSNDRIILSAKGSPSSLDWSLATGRFVYGTVRHDSSESIAEIITTDVNGTDVSIIETKKPLGILPTAGYCEWSPDGTMILRRSGDIYTLKADGSDSTYIRHSYYSEATWAPGGEYILCRGASIMCVDPICLFDLNGNAVKKLSSGNYYGIDWY